MSVVTSWSTFFQTRTRYRGRAYFMGGRVRQIKPHENELVRALVQGTKSYTVTVNGEDGSAIAECTCPTFAGGAYCAHIWATLLEVQQDKSEHGASTLNLAGLKVRPPRARKRAGGSDVSDPKDTSWIDRLNLLYPSTEELDQQSSTILSGQLQICYVVLPEQSAHYGEVVLEIRQRRPIAAGWSKLKPFKISQAILPKVEDPIDRELCALLLGAAPLGERGGGVDRPHSVFALLPGARTVLLKRLILTGRCLLDLDEEADGNEVQLRWDGPESWVLWVVGVEAEKQLVLSAQLQRGTQRMAASEPQVLSGGSDGVVIWSGKAAPFDDRDAMGWVGQFRSSSENGVHPEPIRVPASEIEQFLDRLYMLPQLPELELPPGIGRDAQQLKPVPQLAMFAAGSSEAQPWLTSSTKNCLVVRLSFQYGSCPVEARQPGRFLSLDVGGSERPGETRLVRRDLRAEAQAMSLLASLGVRPVTDSDGQWAGLLAMRHMAGVVTELVAKDWIIWADRQPVRSAGLPSVSVHRRMDWFELDGQVPYERADGQIEQVRLPKILAAARAGRNLVELGDGSTGLLPEKWLQEHGLLTALGTVHGDQIRYSFTQVAMLDALLRDIDVAGADADFSAARQRLSEFDRIRTLHEAGSFKGSLRKYQRDGLGWMAFLRWLGGGGVLADDMGLGKTIQVLALFQARRLGLSEHLESGNGDTPDAGSTQMEHRPSLVVAPRSVVFNWMDESECFTPDMRTVAYAGTDRDALRSTFDQIDMIVTSYGVLRRDIDELRHIPFDYIVLDEAQAIKNPSAQSAKAARLLQSRHRLALTGTPVENHLGDLWSIFEFLNPGMLGSNTRFAQLLRESGSGAVDSDQESRSSKAASIAPGKVEQIATAIRPFILRRTKKQVLADLPEKTEQTIVCELEPSQRQAYDEVRDFYRANLIDRIKTDGHAKDDSRLVSGQSTFMVLEALLRLRQVACHPGLIDDQRADEPAAKIETLLDMLEDVIEEGAKALVFSQFTSLLALVRRRFDRRSIRYTYLDGQTQDRKHVVEQFQTDPSVSVFLISLKAGGFGLNLTAAEYVFILDPWWNPAVESQAIDRAHRIGQSRRVFAYRLICKDTVEQRIVELQQRKRQLAESIIGGEHNLLRSLTREDLDRLLA